MPAPAHPPQVVLLDVDGTLLDSNDAHARCWVEIPTRRGLPVAYADVRARIGMGGDQLLPALFGPDFERRPELPGISEERTALFLAEYLDDLQPTAGARALLEKMRAEGLRLVVATSAGHELERLLHCAGVEDLIDNVASSTDAEHSKPAPDIVSAALAKSAVAPQQAVMLGDTPYDIQAAAAAGVGCIAVRCGGWWKDADLSQALAVYDDPAALLRGWDTSPLAQR